MATIKKGTYRFNDVLSKPNTNLRMSIPFEGSVTKQGVLFVACCSGINVDPTANGGASMDYVFESIVPDIFASYGITYPLPYPIYTPLRDDTWSFAEYGSGVETITVTEDTEVSDEFNTWFTANTKSANATITYNGSTIASLFGGQTATLKCAESKMLSDIVVEVAEQQSGGSDADDTIVNVESLPEIVDNSKIYCFETEVVNEAIIVTNGEAQVNTDYKIVVVDELPESYDSIDTVFIIRNSGIGYMYYYGWYTVGQLLTMTTGITIEDKGYITDEELAEGGFADGIYSHKQFVKNYGIPNTDNALKKTIYQNEGSGWEKTIDTKYYRHIIDNYDADTILPEFLIPNGTQGIRDYAFYGVWDIENVTIPNSVTRIGVSAFQKCGGLSKLDIPESVQRVETNAFADTSLREVTIPSTNIFICYRAFYGTDIYGNTDNWVNNLFYIGHHLLDANESCTGDVTVKDGTKCIQQFAFEYATGITSVTCPESLEYLSHGSLCVINCGVFIFKSKTPPNLQAGAFYSNAVTAIYVPAESVDAYKTATGWINYADIIFPIEE